MISLSSDVENTPKALRTLGRDLVLYRGESGRVVVMDAYCPHMRAHLAAEQTSAAAANRIEGDSIRCPYHGWRFNAEGQCDHIPYEDGKIPSAAKIRSYSVDERYGCVFIWHDSEGGSPGYPLPQLPEWDAEDWTSGPWRDLGTLNVHPQEIVDNLVDARHFGPIHGQKMKYFESIFDGVTGVQLSGGGHETMTSEDGYLAVNAYYTGPGILFGKYSGETDAVQIVCHTPKEDGVTQIWHNILTKNQHSPAAPSDADLNHSYYSAGLAAFSQDFAIWQTKEPAINILRVPHDGPFHRLRLWYRQFYNASADAAKWQNRANGRHPTDGIAAAPDVSIPA